MRIKQDAFVCVRACSGYAQSRSRNTTVTYKFGNAHSFTISVRFATTVVGTIFEPTVQTMFEYVKGLSVNRARKTSAAVVVFCTLDGSVQVAWNLKKDTMYLKKSSVIEYFSNYNSTVYGTGNVFDNTSTDKPVYVYILGEAVEYIDKCHIVELCSVHRTTLFTMFWDTVYFEAQMLASTIGNSRRSSFTRNNGGVGSGNNDAFDKTMDVVPDPKPSPVGTVRATVSVNLLPEFDRCAEPERFDETKKKRRSRGNRRKKSGKFWRLSVVDNRRRVGNYVSSRSPTGQLPDVWLSPPLSLSSSSS